MDYDVNNYIDIENLSSNIDNIINDTLINEFHIDINNYKELVNIKHSTFNYLLTVVCNKLFKPSDYILNYKKTYIDYNNIDLLSILVDIFIKLTKRFNKSVGLYGFASLIGVDLVTVNSWVSEEGKKLNPARFQLLQNIREEHKAQHISLLNDSVVGQIAVANNDNETGLKWAEKQQQQAARQAVYFLPSERLDRLRLEETEPEQHPTDV